MLKSSTITKLKKIVGSSNLFLSSEELVVYSYDATRTSAAPWLVVRPASAADVSEILLLANDEGFPVVPRGAGTGMSGGSVPVRGGVVLSFERMNRIIDINEWTRVAVVEPGVITGDLQREAERRGLFYPPDPASSRFCTIGGNVAECAGGLRAVKYGVTRDYVLGLQVVLPTGKIIRTGSRTLKSVAGYDLTRLIVGSEGTLGIVTEIILRLQPLPESVRTMAAFFNDTDDALRALSNITSARIIPRALEFVDKGALRAVEAYCGADFSNGAAVMLLIETDGIMSAAEHEIYSISEICKAAGALETAIAETAQDAERLWKIRKSISPALYRIKPKKINEDIVVPVDRLKDILSRIDNIARRENLTIVNFGHAGDGNIHVNILFDEKERLRAERAVREILENVLQLQGSITGEHGIGLSKAPYLPMEADEDAIAAMKKIKQALDPNGILNPGKIFLDYRERALNDE